MIISGTELAKETKQDVARRVAEAKRKNMAAHPIS